MGEVVGNGAVDLFECQRGKALGGDRLRRQSLEERENNRIEGHTSAAYPVTSVACFDVNSFHCCLFPSAREPDVACLRPSVLFYTPIRRASTFDPAQSSLTRSRVHREHPAQSGATSSSV